MSRLASLVCVTWLCAAVPVPALAQQRLFVSMPQEIVELDPRPATRGAVLRRFPLPLTQPLAARELVPFLGGHYLVGVTEWDAVVLLNTRSGALERVAVADFIPRRIVGTDGNARLLVLGFRSGSIDSVVLVADARSGQRRFIDVGRVSPFAPAIAYAAAGDRLFVAQPRGVAADTYHDIDVIQASTGARVKRLDIWPLSATALATNEAGTQLVVTALTQTVRLDVSSGTREASTTSDVLRGTSFPKVLDEARNRLLTNLVLPEGANPELRNQRGISVFSADSLHLLGRVQLPELPLNRTSRNYTPVFAESLNVSGLSASIFVLQGEGVRPQHLGGPRTCGESRLFALDAPTGRLRQMVRTTDALGNGGCDAALVRITEPAPPVAPTVEMTGSRVTLAWPVTVGATHYDVEVGSAPGAADLAIIRAAESQLVVDGVPPGRYHLRVRAINSIGRSGASRETAVTVQ